MSTATAMITMEGVLLKGSVPNGQPIDVGIRLYHSLKHYFRLVLSCSVDNEDWWAHWISINGLKDHAGVLGRIAIDNDDDMDVRLRHMNQLRAEGVLDLVIDPDAYVCGEAMRLGVVSLQFGAARYTEPKHMRRRREWNEIDKTVTARRPFKDLEPGIDTDAYEARR